MAGFAVVIRQITVIVKGIMEIIKQIQLSIDLLVGNQLGRSKMNDHVTPGFCNHPKNMLVAKGPNSVHVITGTLAATVLSVKDWLHKSLFSALLSLWTIAKQTVITSNSIRDYVFILLTVTSARVTLRVRWAESKLKKIKYKYMRVERTGKIMFKSFFLKQSHKLETKVSIGIWWSYARCYYKAC